MGFRCDDGTDLRTTSLMARLWVLNLSDGKHSLLDIAEPGCRSALPERVAFGCPKRCRGKNSPGRSFTRKQLATCVTGILLSRSQDQIYFEAEMDPNENTVDRA
jgi:hypothetical protein